MRDRFLSRWRGILLSLVGIAAIAWLAATGRLGLYIHPRYFVFTIVMAAIAGVVALVAAALLPSTRDDETDADHGHPQDRAPRRTGVATALSIVLVAASAVALLVVPPSALTSATVDQRAINTAGSGDADTVELAGADSSALSIKDWSGLLRQGADEEFLAGRTPTLVGFVTPDPDDPENVFYVARFVVTCCAVDAQPVGVPVYLPGWRENHPVDSWVSVTGGFAANPSTASAQEIVVLPREITATEQPADPYVY